MPQRVHHMFFSVIDYNCFQKFVTVDILTSPWVLKMTITNIYKQKKAKIRGSFCQMSYSNQGLKFQLMKAQFYKGWQ